MGIVISILNNKGGVGKSTYNLEYELSKMDKKLKTSTKFKDAVMRFESITQYAREKFDGAIAYNNVAKEIMSW